MTKHKIHVYTRISKTYQQEGSGLDEQLSRIDAYIKSKPEFLGSEITYWQDVGVSAFKNKNIHDGQLAEFIKQVESGSIGSGHALV
ncbi:recombinase family protein, partial [Klebsiella pneumoniae]